MKLIKIKSKKRIKEIIREIKKNASKYNFVVREVFDMAYEFKNHKIDVQNNFKYYSIMLCNPQKAYESISKKSIRGALLLPPKQVVIYQEDDKTILAYVAVEEEDVKKLFPEDKMFQKGLSDSCQNIIKLIKEIED